MSCSGCSGAVERALNRLGNNNNKERKGKENNNYTHIGVESVKTDLEKQEVVVVSERPIEEVLATIQKTGKTVSVKN